MSDFKIVSVLNPTVVLTGGPFISAGASGQATGTVVFSNSNGVSFGLSNGVMTASAAGGGGGVAISAGTNSTSTGTVVFSNANGVSFGMDTNGVVTGTVATNYQSQGAYLTTAMASNRGTDFVQATAAFAGTNASGTIASNGISVSVAATVAQTVQTQASGNIAGIGFTSTTTAGTAIVGTNSTNGLSLGVPAFITTYINDLTSGRAGTGFTSTTTAGTAVTAALGTNGLSMAVPNFLTTAMQSGASTQFVQANAAFFGTNASGTIASNAISISVAAGGTGGGGGVAISAGTNSTSTGTVVFSNASGVSFGMNTNGVVTATVKTDYLTTQSVQTQASGNIAGIGFTTASTAGTAIVGTNSTNGLSLGIPAYITTFANDLTSGRAGTGFTSTTTAGTAITAALGTNGLTMGVPQFITTYVNDLTSGRAGTGFTSTTTAGTAITAALGTNGLTMAVPQFLTTAMQSNAATISNINISAGTTSNNLSAFVFSNNNGLAFGLSGSTITGSYSQSNQAFSAAGGSSTFQTLGFSDNAYASWTNSNGSVALTELRGSFFAVSNTTQSSSGTQNIDAFSFAGAGGVSVGVSNGSVVISGATGGTINQTGPNIAVPGTTITAGTVVFSNANGVSFGLDGSTMTVSASGANTVSYYKLQELGNNSVLSSYGQNSLHFQIMRPEENISMTAIQMLVSISAASANNPQTAGNTYSYGLYTRGTGASSTQYLSLATSSMFVNVSANGNANWGYTVGQGTQSATASNAASSAIVSLLTGMKVFVMPFSTSVSPSVEYLLGFARSTSSGGVANTLFNNSQLVMTALSGASASFGAVGITGGLQITATTRTQEFQQVVYTATSGAWPATMGVTQVTNNGASVNHMYAWLEA
jgi:hypothetical protein